MLIRWATEEERASYGFDPGIYGEYEVLAVVDRMSGRRLGLGGFSREGRKIGKLSIIDFARKDEIEEKLRSCADRQINPKGASFHYKYASYARDAVKETCPGCNALPMPKGQFNIAELPHSWVGTNYAAQGRLFGWCYVMAKHHSALFYDVPREVMADYMSEVQETAAALHRITQAVKINYEIHGNSGAHLHCHLFPRYLDDSFPSGPIDYRITEPSPYESRDEFDWFVAEMRSALAPMA